MIDSSLLKLRRCRPADVDAVWNYRSRVDVATHLRAGPWTREHTARELAAYANASFETTGDELVLLAETHDTSEVAGEVGLFWRAASPPIAEVGYVFNPDFGGRGLATAAVSAILRWALVERDFSFVIAVTDADNTASRALCERVGMALIMTSTSTDGRDVAECTYGIGNGSVHLSDLDALLRADH